VLQRECFRAPRWPILASPVPNRFRRRSSGGAFRQGGRKPHASGDMVKRVLRRAGNLAQLRGISPFTSFMTPEKSRPSRPRSDNDW
jgi:hypothetical protein